MVMWKLDSSMTRVKNGNTRVWSRKVHSVSKWTKTLFQIPTWWMCKAQDKKKDVHIETVWESVWNGFFECLQHLEPPSIPCPFGVVQIAAHLDKTQSLQSSNAFATHYDNLRGRLAVVVFATRAFQGSSYILFSGSKNPSLKITIYQMKLERWRETDFPVACLRTMLCCTNQTPSQNSVKMNKHNVRTMDCLELSHNFNDWIITQLANL